MSAREKTTILFRFAWLVLAVFAVACVLAGAYHEYCHHTHLVQHSSVEQILAGCQAPEAKRLTSTQPATVERAGAMPPSIALPTDDYSFGVFRPPWLAPDFLLRT